MFEGQLIGWRDKCGGEIHCGDVVKLTLEEIAEYVEYQPRYETISHLGRVEYDATACAFVVLINGGPAWSFGEFDPSEIEVISAINADHPIEMTFADVEMALGHRVYISDLQLTSNETFISFN